ncbi:hypothetical protein Tco_1454414, partial [Tanacetum coccineum]
DVKHHLPILIKDTKGEGFLTPGPSHSIGSLNDIFPLIGIDDRRVVQAPHLPLIE